ncbi:unnamed protein product [Penicillium manginii]
MTYNISIGRLNPEEDDPYLSDEGSSGVHVDLPIPGSHDPEYEVWEDVPYPEDLVKPSDSASRPRTSHRNRSIHGSRSASARRPPRRHMESGYPSTRPRHRQASPAESAGSGDSEDFPPHDYPPQYDTRPRERRWAPQAPQVPPPPPSSNGYPPAHPGAGYPHPNGVMQPDSSLIRQLPGAKQYGYPYGHQYPQGAPQGPPHGAPPGMHSYYAQDPAYRQHPSHQPPQMHNPNQQPLVHHMAMHGTPPPFGGSPFQHEMVAYGANGFYNYPRDPREQYAMMAALQQQSFFPHYPQPTPAPPEPTPTPAPAAPTPAPAPAPAPAPEPAPAPPADTAKDEAIARLEKLILDDRLAREAKEAEAIAKIEQEAKDAAAAAAQLAHDRKIAGEAAALARADAEQRAAEDAAKAKEEAEKAAAAAAADAATAATAAAAAAAADAAAAKEAEAAKAAAPPPPAEKKKPIKFKDAVGRKFSFPFELCATWQGMEDLIKQAFLHIEVIGPHVADGHYDLVGPNGDIILPQVWETVIEPDWSITMHMWPIPEKPKEPDPPPAAEAPAEPPKEAAPPPAAEAKKPAPKKPRPPPGQPGGFASWMMGGRKPPRGKAAPKKAEAAPAAAPAPAPAP